MISGWSLEHLFHDRFSPPFYKMWSPSSYDKIFLSWCKWSLPGLLAYVYAAPYLNNKHANCDTPCVLVPLYQKSLLDQTTRASIRSLHASVSLGRPWPCRWFTTVPSFCEQNAHLLPSISHPQWRDNQCHSLHLSVVIILGLNYLLKNCVPSLQQTSRDQIQYHSAVKLLWQHLTKTSFYLHKSRTQAHPEVFFGTYSRNFNNLSTTAHLLMRIYCLYRYLIQNYTFLNEIRTIDMSKTKSNIYSSNSVSY